MRPALAPILFSRPGWVPYGASLAFDFTRGRGWTPNSVRPAAGMLTTTRASDAYADSNSGFWQAFTSGQPRITDKGLLVEEARTNSIRNNSMQGAVAGTPGTRPTNWSAFSVAGLTQTIVGVGIENGIDYIDIRFNGTSSGTAIAVNMDTTTGIAALNGQVWTPSTFIALVGGTFANVGTVVLRCNMRDAGGTSITSQETSDFKSSIGASLSRQSGTVTLNNASTAFVFPQIIITVSDASAIDITLRIGWPQLELGAFATSPIRTTSAAATRAADSVRLTNVPALGGTWTAFLDATAGDVSATRQFLTGGGSDRIVYAASLNAVAAVFNGASALSAASGSGGWLTGAKAASAADGTGRSLVMSGGTVATDANLQTFPANIYFGGSTTATGVTTVRRMALFPTRLTNAQLQALTAP